MYSYDTMLEMTVISSNQTWANCTLPYRVDKIPLILLYSMVLIIGLPANMATVYMTFLQVRRKNVLGIYLLSLSLCDLMYLCTLPMWAVYVGREHKWPWTSFACKLTSYIFFNNMYISIFLLCCVSVDRYVTVAYGLESRGLRQQKLAGAITSSICLLVALGHLPVFTMAEGETDQQQSCFEPSQPSFIVTGFNYARFVIGFLLPMAILVVTNCRISTSIQASETLLARQKYKIKCLTMVVIIFFLVCFGPYHLILLLRAVTFHIPQLRNDCDFEIRVYTPYTISLGLSTVNSAMNPILYVLASDNIRKEMRHGLAALIRRSIQRHQTDSSQNKMQSSEATQGRENPSS
ncbi:probable G-protein coupled receptor 132 isoform X1 [Paramormyrops kingsleyae]|uniref:G protein-coupled receptor 132b n=2 Tax=Paramormyrops kingsleyae TaxID=1676925 RepID=A0A3B3RTJ9_9TELE|nr:probable G-protein coupled receptor 132 isoform X1 [Paramormyrops kingsleyae]